MAVLRKYLSVLLLALLLLVCASALAETEVSLSPAPATVAINERNGFTLLTAENVDQHIDLLRQIGVSKNDLLADFQARGVAAQYWSNPKSARYTCLEISVSKNDESALYPDLIHSPDAKDSWAAFKAGYKDNPEWTAQGYSFYSWEQKVAKSNYYLLMEYNRTAYRGYMARTTYKGFILTFDYRTYNQKPVRQHATNLYNVIKTFAETAGVVPGGDEAAQPGEPGAAPEGESGGTVPVSVPLNITAAPPEETNTNTFTVEGITQPGAHVIGVLMRITSDEPLRYETDAHARTGKFTLKVTLPEAEETYWLMTLNVFVDDKLATEKTFPLTLYKKNLIPVAVSTEVPEITAGDELRITGTTSKITEIQCIATCADYNWTKNVRTNNSGMFDFKIPLKYEGEYNVVLVFNKKGFETKRLSWTVTRAITDEARSAELRKTAKTVSYSNLTRRIDQYVGQTVTFQAWVTAIEPVGDEWRVTAARTLTGENHYSQFVVFMADEEPPFAVEEKHTFYGKCIGPYMTQSEEGTESVPSFDLLLWD